MKAEPQRIIDKENPAAAQGYLLGSAAKTAFVIGIAFSAFQLWTATFTPLSSQVVRSVHVGFLLAMTFTMFSWRSQSERQHVPWWDWLLVAAGFGLGLYHLFFEHDILLRAGDPNTADLVVGTAVIILLFEAARRIMGWGLPIICGIFIPYAFFGRYLPDFMAHRGFGLDQIIDQLFLGTEGIYGTPTFVSATYIFLFILFGSFLEHAGMIRLFTDVSLGLVGHAKGGPAKVAVISSGLMGTINGSGVANVLTTGQFTIPLMMRFGYRPAFAGAVEATASMGGQIMPPVMGAVAFIMAETIGVPYSEVAIAAAIPAILYYSSAFWMVHLEAERCNLVGMPKAECPNALKAIRQGWYLVLPLAALVFLLFAGFTPLFAGVIGLACTALLILGHSVAEGLTTAFRVVFWVALGLAAAFLLKSGFRTEFAAASLVGFLIVVGLFLGRGRATLGVMLQSLADGAKNAVGVGVACALVGILIGVMTMTGLASSFAGMVVALAGDNLLLALVLTMIACIVLGTGIPTIPNYIITASIAAPVLLKMGVPLIVSHMFVFYFGIMADLTPPVALAALAASSIARVSHLTIGFVATRIAIAGYVVPFMAVYAPELMLQGGTWVDTAYIVFKAVLGIGLWGAAATGHWKLPLNWTMRGLATAAAGLLVTAGVWTDVAGFALATAIIGWEVMRWRRSAS